MSDLFGGGVTKGAIFSDCGQYRYLLTRTWDRQRPILLGLLCNPSNAGWEDNDPTTSQMINRARRAGFGAWWAINMFAATGTDPNDLYAFADPVGPMNDEFIRWAATQAERIVVAFGNHKAIGPRRDDVLQILSGKTLCCMGTNQDGSPRFPRAIPVSQEFVPWAKP